MKKLLIFSVLNLAFTLVYSQTVNTLPNSGNVGLGTSSPDTKLQVCGDVKIDSSLTVKEDVEAKSDLKVDGDVYLNGDLYFTNGVPITFSPTQLAVFGSGGQLRGASINDILPYIYGEDCRILTDANGNVLSYPAPMWQSTSGQFYGILHTGWQCPARVGIGTNNPVAELDVNGKAHVEKTMGIGVNPNPVVVLDIKEINDPNYSTTTLINAVGNDGNFRLRNNGEINLNSNTTGYAISLDNANSSGQGIYIEGGDGPGSTNNYGLINVVAAGKQIFYVDGKSSITYAREVKVNTNTVWPDYVFEEDYDKMTPEEKEIYFKENKHLPGVPSAAEMNKDGIPVAETLNGLTKNVEENSLDINFLYRELQNLKAENEKLKREIEDLKNK